MKDELISVSAYFMDDERRAAFTSSFILLFNSARGRPRRRASRARGRGCAPTRVRAASASVRARVAAPRWSVRARRCVSSAGACAPRETSRRSRARLRRRPASARERGRRKTPRLSYLTFFPVVGLPHYYPFPRVCASAAARGSVFFGGEVCGGL